MYQLEALASGIPIVQPNLGAFKEIVEETKAGAVYSPNNSLALCKKWIEILSDENQLKTMSENGVKAISGKYNTIELAKKISAIYDSIIEN